MNERYLLRCKVYALSAWAVCALLVVAAWVVMILQPTGWHYAGLLAFSAAIVSGIAATLHVRSFMVRVCALIRSTAVTYHPETKAKGLFPVGGGD